MGKTSRIAVRSVCRQPGLSRLLGAAQDLPRQEMKHLTWTPITRHVARARSGHGCASSRSVPRRPIESGSSWNSSEDRHGIAVCGDVLEEPASVFASVHAPLASRGPAPALIVRMISRPSSHANARAPSPLGAGEDLLVGRGRRRDRHLAQVVAGHVERAASQAEVRGAERASERAQRRTPEVVGGDADSFVPPPGSENVPPTS